MEVASIVFRMTHYFDRQILYFEEVLSALAMTDEQLSGEALKECIAQQHERTKGMQRLGEEFDVLKREWDSAHSISEESRAEIRSLAKRADELSEEVRGALERDVRMVGSAMDVLQESFSNLRQGHDMLDGYHAGDESKPRVMDKKA